MAALAREIIGQSSRRYIARSVLQESRGPLGPVLLAMADRKRYVLKSVPDDVFGYYQNMFNDLRPCPYVRVAADAIPEKHMFAYGYLDDHLLSFAQKDVPLPLTKRILRDTLRGLAALHERGIVHTDVKPNNIMLNWNDKNRDIAVEKVQLADIDDAAYVPEGSALVGRAFGNWMWRSPEAHASAACHTPTEMFSFGIVCIYALLKRVIFAVEDEEIIEGEVKEAVVLERQLSYFADGDSYQGLLRYLADNPWVQVFEIVATTFGEKYPREPFALWNYLDADFRDLVGRMSTVDLRKRITAHEALGHQWFADIQD
ncbi:kinase-like protein [Aaosphaeria arxii CBS 175.79]|uniref:Kinase-like protein n=1 Tax=Aaosphaeria arxii CBS 175.79 TaxID=1450172 RepID=A0A6A5XMW5_9PLEO|nr:kinase-like protein [Aaosphaeria arxii CBS 175.79]KAF2014219.1 kinase-like protein [Aaosphaeria arxii CBS 175.79]